MTDTELLERGKLRLHWAEMHTPVLQAIRERFRKEQPFKGLKVAVVLHLEAKTGVLAITLAEGGAEVRIMSSNPLTTDDSVALALNECYPIRAYGRKGESMEEYEQYLNEVLDMKPDYIVDDGADAVTLVHTKRKELLADLKGACEETTTGVVRLRSMAKNGVLGFPVMAANDAKLKYLFDNRYGTGQSILDGWMNATNMMISGKHVVVAGYGWCGKGVAKCAKGLGALVTVTEIDPIKAIEARMDGFEVMPMIEAAKNADIIFTVTGVKDIVTAKIFDVMKDGCVMGNCGHFDCEVNVRELREMARSVKRAREFIDEYEMPDGRKLFVIGEGRLMNLVAGQGHPAEIMDTSFAVQALSLEYLVKNHADMKNEVYVLPDSIDEMIARYKLDSLGIKIDELTEEQIRYISAWEEGTQ